MTFAHAEALEGLDEPTCFVVMPFVERSGHLSSGFFDEVYEQIIEPAVMKAGFRPESARRIGTEVIHATIVRAMFEAPMVLVDVTDHNANVCIEFGLRLAWCKPVCLIKARGTPAIFDVDPLRYLEYEPDLWPSKVAADVPRVAAHLRATWERRLTEPPFVDRLRWNAGWLGSLSNPDVPAWRPGR